MPIFSNISKRQLATCDKRLQRLLNEAIKYVDFRVVEGHRNKAGQDKAFAQGASKVRWPYGNHNKKPSRAADLAPWPIDWSNDVRAVARFAFMMGVIYKISVDMGIKIRLGMDWDGDGDTRDQTFMDWGHIELDEP